jgi:hypothetical protein
VKLKKLSNETKNRDSSTQTAIFLQENVERGEINLQFVCIIPSRTKVEFKCVAIQNPTMGHKRK